MPSKKNILYFYTAESPFVEKDIEFLSENFNISRFRFNLYNKKFLFLTLLKQLCFIIKNVFSSKIFICQFAGMHAALPIIIGKCTFKKSIIVAGGTDCVSFPSINYGNFSGKLNSFLTRLCFKNCSLIIPVHESLIYYDYSYDDSDYSHQGIKFFIPNLKTPIKTIYNGYDSTYWKNTGNKTSKTFITVLGHVNSRFTISLKGIDLFIELSRIYPDCNFSIVGGATISIVDKPTNLELLPTIWGHKLVELFSSKQFYVQLSMSEGFPNALCEAMLCECVPIVSAVGAMPQIVNECGYLLKKKDLNLLTSLVDKALASPELTNLGKASRQKIHNSYSIAIRKEKFLHAIINQ